MFKIAAFVDTARASGRSFLAGIKKYSLASSNWQIYTPIPAYFHKNIEASHFPALSDLDGVILRDVKFPTKLSHLKIPVIINDTMREHIPGVCSLSTASDEIAKMAADHFLELGFKNLAFSGWSNLPWSQKRHEHFTRIVQIAGVKTCCSYMETKALPDHSKISRWIASLPKPAAIFACNDDFAVQILECCQADHIAVPEEIAVLGVDNDELICDLAKPSLSSIELDFEKVGFEAAKMLDQMITGRSKPHDLRIRPVRIIARQSTNMLAIDDVELRNALIFIRANYMQNIQVEHVASAVNISKRSLSLKFRKILNRTVKGELLRLRIESLKLKLLNSGEPLATIASDLEYTDPEHLCRYFKNAVGLTPTQFRQHNI